MNSDSNPGRSTLKTVHIAGSRINCPCHVCAIFNSDDEEYAVLVPFMRELLSPAIEEVHLALRIDANHEVNCKISPICGHRVVATALDA